MRLEVGDFAKSPTPHCPQIPPQTPVVSPEELHFQHKRPNCFPALAETQTQDAARPSRVRAGRGRGPGGSEGELLQLRGFFARRGLRRSSPQKQTHFAFRLRPSCRRQEEDHAAALRPSKSWLLRKPPVSSRLSKLNGCRLTLRSSQSASLLPQLRTQCCQRRLGLLLIQTGFAGIFYSTSCTARVRNFAEMLRVHFFVPVLVLCNNKTQLETFLDIQHCRKHSVTPTPN